MMKRIIILMLLILAIFVNAYSSESIYKRKQHSKKQNKAYIEEQKKKSEEERVRAIERENAILKQQIDQKIEIEHGGESYDPFNSYIYKRGVYNHNKR